MIRLCSALAELVFVPCGFAAEPAQIDLEVAVIQLPEGAADDLDIKGGATMLTARESKLLETLFLKERASGNWRVPTRHIQIRRRVQGTRRGGDAGASS